MNKIHEKGYVVMGMISAMALVIILQMFIVILFIVAPISIIYFTIRHTANKARKENMSKIDFSIEKEYYREILKGHSPAELSYIDDFKIRIPREIVATLLNLKLKKRIEINKDKIEVVDSNLDGLRKTERFLLENIKEGKLKILDSRYIESYAQDEAIKDKLIEKNTDEKVKTRIKRKNLKGILQGIIIFIIIVILCVIIKIDGITTMLILAFAFFGYSMIYIFTSLSYSLMVMDSYSRTEEGEKLNKKIEGLKQYIKDYSLLNKREQEDLILWEEYLIYSVIFDINSTTIVEEISKLIEIEYGPGRKNM